MRTLLVDGDIFAFQVSAANEVVIEWPGDVWTLHSHLEPCKDSIERQFSNLMRDLEADKLIVCLSDGTNWRKEVFPLYKANRVGKRKPIVYSPLRNWLTETYECFQRPGLEGDDIMGILATRKFGADKEQRVIVSIDKDMQTIPCLYYNNAKPEEGIRMLTEKAADYKHFYQTLTGDTTDNYPGCPSVGPKKAEAILDGYKDNKEAWARIVAAYEKQGLDEEDALVNARVARILRASDYDFKEKKVKLWEAPK